MMKPWTTVAEQNQKQFKDTQYSMKPGADFTDTVSRKGSRVDLEVGRGGLGHTQ